MNNHGLTAALKCCVCLFNVLLVLIQGKGDNLCRLTERERLHIKGLQNIFVQVRAFIWRGQGNPEHHITHSVTRVCKLLLRRCGSQQGEITVMPCGGSTGETLKTVS